jgi:DNA-binding response OmpR family regulator
LVVEDDRALAVGLDLNLSAEGYQVMVANDGESALRLALERVPSLVLLDLRLPDLDGMEVLAELRRRGRTMPVIILSARGEDGDKIQGLEGGADDYVTKPFNLHELLARVKAALRRAGLSATPSEWIALGDVSINLTEREVRKGDEVVHLTSREFDLLAFLLKYPGRTYTREALLAGVWGYDYEGTARTVDNFVRNLRVKLELDPTEPRHLLTVHGIGYRLQR